MVVSSFMARRYFAAARMATRAAVASAIEATMSADLA
jgi:hypothetical protein